MATQLLAQGLSLEAAASMGVFIHACTGDLLAQRAGERGMLASDIIAHLPELINS